MPHTGLKPALRLQERLAALKFLEQVFPTRPRSQRPTNRQQVARNTRIREDYEAGVLMSDLSREHGISRQRISQIVHRRRS